MIGINFVPQERIQFAIVARDKLTPSLCHIRSCRYNGE